MIIRVKMQVLPHTPHFHDKKTKKPLFLQAAIATPGALS